MDMDGAKEELQKIIVTAKKSGITSKKNIPTLSLVRIAEKHGLGSREVCDLLDQIWESD